MKIKPEQLQGQLRPGGATLFWLTGDEPLLLQEAADQVRHHFREQGFLEREVLTVDKSFNWDGFHALTSNLSLFAERKLIELRLTSSRLEEAGRKALLEYLEQPSPDIALLITSPRLDKGVASTKWFKQLENTGVVIQYWPLGRESLPNWLGARLIAAGIQADPDALQILVDKVEGNLLAAMQEIEKLKMLSDGGEGGPVRLDAKTVMQLVSDHSRYNVFQLVDAALSGDVPRSQKILSGLKSEGVFPLVLVNAFSRELHALLPMVQRKQSGQGVNQILQVFKVWFNRKAAVGSALNRLDEASIWRQIDHCHRIDLAIKGVASLDVWTELSQLLLDVAGKRVASSA